MTTAPAVEADTLQARAKQIVVGYDGSVTARRALVRAAELAGYGTTITVVSVARSLYRPPYEPVADPLERERSRRAAEEARDLLLARHITSRTLETVGDPADTLLTAAEDLEADLIVVGRNDGDAPEPTLLGSVSLHVMHRASCDVLMVH